MIIYLRVCVFLIEREINTIENGLFLSFRHMSYSINQVMIDEMDKNQSSWLRTVWLAVSVSMQFT